MHWASDLIGAPWHPEAYGPDRFFCWGLVHWVFANRLGIEMPKIVVGVSEVDNVSAIKKASQDSGWRPAPAPERAFDIVLMVGRLGRHVGLVIDTKPLMVLHADGYVDEKRVAHGSVVAQPLRLMGLSGYGHIELWRRSA